MLAAAAGDARAQGHEVDELLRRYPLGEDAIRIDVVTRTAFASIHLLQLRGETEPATHEGHEEVIVIERGAATVALGEAGTAVLDRSDWVVIPAGAPHAIRSEGAGPLAALVIAPPAAGDLRGAHRARPEPRAPELNRLLLEVRRAILARDPAALEALSAAEARQATATARPAPEPDHPQRRAELVAMLEAVARNPFERFLLGALQGFPRIEAPAGTAEVAVEALTAPGDDQVLARAAFARVAGRWLVEEWQVEPRGEAGRAIRELGPRDPAAAEAGIERVYGGPSFFGALEPADLRLVLIAEAAARPELGALAAEAPWVRGLWHRAARVRVAWRPAAPAAPARRVDFERAPDGGWRVTDFEPR